MSTPENPADTRPRPSNWRRWFAFLRYHGRNWVRGIGLDWCPARRVFRSATRETVKADARAGLNVALLAFPQSIAYAFIAGVPPQFGLMSSSVGAITGPLFSGSRFIVLGPTNATAILMFSGLAAAGLKGYQYAAALPLFILMVGLFQVLGAVVHFSQVLNYVSRTVVTGYLAGAAALIVVNQLPNVLGFKAGNATTFFGVLTDTLRRLPATRAPEVLLGVGTLAVFLAFRRWLPRWPHVVCTLVLMSLAAAVCERLGWRMSYLKGFALHEIPLLKFSIDFDLIGQLVPPALALAFVAVLEGSSVGKGIASRSGARLNTNQEIYGMGVANLASALCGGMDASGSLTRSTLSATSGARTALATVLSGVFVLTLLFSLGFLIGAIPKTTLAVIVICIAISLFSPHHIRAALRTTRSDAIVFAVTTIGALTVTLDAAIYLGAFASVILFLRKAAVPELVEYNFNPSGQLAEMNNAAPRDLPAISILHAEGDLFFGSTELFVQQMREVIRDPSLRVIILRLKNARNLDATCALAIEELADFLRAGGRHLLVSGADRDVQRVFRNSGLMDRIGRENFFREVPSNPTVSTRQALLRAQALIGQREAHVRIFVDAAKAAASQPAGA